MDPSSPCRRTPRGHFLTSEACQSLCQAAVDKATMVPGLPEGRAGAALPRRASATVAMSWVCEGRCPCSWTRVAAGTRNRASETAEDLTLFHVNEFKLERVHTAAGYCAGRRSLWAEGWATQKDWNSKSEDTSVSPASALS